MTGDCPHGRPVMPDGTGAACRHCAREARRGGLAAGRAARDHGVALTLERPGGEWDARVVLHAIVTLAEAGREFTADDVRELLPPVDAKVIGSAFSIAARRGLIVEVGTRQSAAVSRHAGLNRVWRGRATPERPSRSTSRPAPPPPAPARDNPPPAPTDVKALRLLAEGKVRIVRADSDGLVVAHIRGDSGDWTVRRTPHGNWSCSCVGAAYRRTCAHVTAVQAVTEPRRTA